MTKPTTLARMTCALLTVHALAHAQAPADTHDRASPDRPIEITPYVSVGSAASSGVGAAVRWPIGSKFGVELETELKRDQITAVAMALSLVYDLPAIWGRRHALRSRVGVACCAAGRSSISRPLGGRAELLGAHPGQQVSP